RLEPRQPRELRAEPRGVQLAERVARADVDPGVPADEAELETAAVGPFLADLIGAVDQRRIAEYEGASLAAADVLGLVEADRPASAEGTERGSAKRGSDRLRRILDERKRARHRAQVIHVAGVSGLMHGDHGPRARPEEASHFRGIQAPPSIHRGH